MALDFTDQKERSLDERISGIKERLGYKSPLDNLSMDTELIPPEQALAEKYKPQQITETFTPEEEEKARQNMTEYIRGAEENPGTWANMVGHAKVGAWTASIEEEIAQALNAGDRDGATELSEFKNQFVSEHQKAVEKGDPNALQNTLYQFGQTLPFMFKIEVARNLSKLSAYGIGKVGARTLGESAVAKTITRQGLRFASGFVAEEGGKTVMKKGLMGLIGKSLAKRSVAYAASDAVLTPMQMAAGATGVGAAPAVMAEVVQNLAFAGMILWDVIELSRTLTKDEKTGLTALKRNPNLVSPTGAASASIINQMTGAAYSEIAARGPEFAKRLDPNVLRGGALLESSIESLFSPATIINPVGTAAGKMVEKGFAKMFIRGAMEKGIKSRIMLAGARVAGGVALTGGGEATEEGAQAAVRQKYQQESLKAILDEHPELATAAAINSEITGLVDSEAKDYLKTFVEETVAAIPVSLCFGVMGLPGYAAGIHRDIQYDRIAEDRNRAQAELEARLEGIGTAAEKVEAIKEMRLEIEARHEGDKGIGGWSTAELLLMRELGVGMQENAKEAGLEADELAANDMVNEIDRSLLQGDLLNFLTASKLTNEQSKDAVDAILVTLGYKTEDGQMSKADAKDLFKKFQKWRKKQGLEEFETQDEMLRLLLGDKYDLLEKSPEQIEQGIEGLQSLIKDKAFNEKIVDTDKIEALESKMTELGIPVDEKMTVADMIKAANGYIGQQEELAEQEKKKEAENKRPKEVETLTELASTIPSDVDTATKIAMLKDAYSKQTGESAALSDFEIQKEALGETWSPESGAMPNAFLDSVGSGNEQDVKVLKDAILDKETNIGLTKTAIRRILKGEKGIEFFEALFPEAVRDKDGNLYGEEMLVKNLSERDELQKKRASKPKAKPETETELEVTEEDVRDAFDEIGDEETKAELKEKVDELILNGEFKKAKALIDEASNSTESAEEEQGGQAPVEEPPQNPTEPKVPENPAEPADAINESHKIFPDETIRPKSGNGWINQSQAEAQAKKNKYDGYKPVPHPDNSRLWALSKEVKKPEDATPPADNKNTGEGTGQIAPKPKAKPLTWEERSSAAKESIGDLVRKFARLASKAGREARLSEIEILNAEFDVEQKTKAFDAAIKKGLDLDKRDSYEANLSEAKKRLSDAKKNSGSSIATTLGVTPSALDEVYDLVGEAVKINPDQSLTEKAGANSKIPMMIARAATISANSSLEAYKPSFILKSKDGSTSAIQIPAEFINQETGELLTGVRAEWAYLGSRYVFDDNVAPESRHSEEMMGLRLSFQGDLKEVYGENPFIVASRRMDGKPFFVTSVERLVAERMKKGGQATVAPTVPWMGYLTKSENKKLISLTSQDQGIAKETSQAVATVSENGLSREVALAVRGPEITRGFVAIADRESGGILETTNASIDNTVKTALDRVIYRLVVESKKSRSRAELLRWALKLQSERGENSNFEGRPVQAILKKEKELLNKAKADGNTEMVSLYQQRVDNASTWYKNRRSFMGMVKKEIGELIPGTRDENQRKNANRKMGQLSRDAREKMWAEFKDGLGGEITLKGTGVEDNIVGNISGKGIKFNIDGKTEAEAEQVIADAKKKAIVLARRRFKDVKNWRGVERDGEMFATPTRNQELSPFLEMVLGEYARRYRAGSFRIGEFLKQKVTELDENGDLVDVENDSVLAKAIERLEEIFLEGEINDENSTFKLTPIERKELGSKKAELLERFVNGDQIKKTRYASWLAPISIKREGDGFRIVKDYSLYQIKQSVPEGEQDILENALVNLALDARRAKLQEQIKVASESAKQARADGRMADAKKSEMLADEFMSDFIKLAVMYFPNITETQLEDARMKLQAARTEIAVEKSTRELLSALLAMVDYSELTNAEKNEAFTEIDRTRIPGGRVLLFNDFRGNLYDVDEEGNATFNDDEEASPFDVTPESRLWADVKIAELWRNGEVVTDEKMAELVEQYRREFPDSKVIGKPTAEGQRIIDAALKKKKKQEKISEIKHIESLFSFPAMTAEDHEKLNVPKDGELSLEELEARKQAALDRIVNEIPIVLGPNATKAEKEKSRQLLRARAEAAALEMARLEGIQSQASESVELESVIPAYLDINPGAKVTQSKTAEQIEAELDKQFPNRNKTKGKLNTTITYRVKNEVLDKAYRDFVAGAAMPPATLEAIVQFEAKSMRLDYRKVDGGYILGKGGRDLLIVSQTGEQIVSPEGERKGASTEFRVNEIDLVTIANIGSGVGAVRHELAEWSFKRLLSPSEQAVIMKQYGSAHEWANAMETWTGSRQHNRLNIIMNKVANFFRRILGMSPLKVDQFVENSIKADQINELFRTGALTERSVNESAVGKTAYSDFKQGDIQSRKRGKHSVPTPEALKAMNKAAFDSAYRSWVKFMEDGGIVIKLGKDKPATRAQKEHLMARKKMYVARAIAQIEKTVTGRAQWKAMTKALTRGNFGLDSMMNLLAENDPSGVIADSMEALKTAETEHAARIQSRMESAVRGILPAKEAKAEYKVKIGGKEVSLRGDEIASLLVMSNDPDIKKALESGETSLVFEKGLRSIKNKQQFFVTKDDLARLKGVLPSEKAVIDGWRKFSMIGRDESLPVLKEIVKSKNNFTGLTEDSLGAFDNDFWAPVNALESMSEFASYKNKMTMNPSWAHMRKNSGYKGKTLIVSDINALAASHARNVAQLAGKGIELQNIYEMLADKHSDTKHFVGDLPHGSTLRDAGRLDTFVGKLQTAFSQEVNPFAQGDDITRHPLFRSLKQGQDIYRLGNLWTMAKMASSSHLITPLLNDTSSYRAALRTPKINDVTEGRFMLNSYMWMRGETAVSQSAGDSMTAAMGRAVVSGEKNLLTGVRSVMGKADRLAMRTIFISSAYDNLPAGMPKTLASLRSMENNEEFWAGVQQKANRMVMETQPTTESYMRGDLQNRRTLITTALTRYSTQTNRMANMLWKSFNAYKSEKTPDAPEQFLKTATSVLVTNAVVLTMIGAGKKLTQDIMKAMARGDEDDDELYPGEKKKTQYSKVIGTNLRNTVAGLVQGGDEAMLLLDATLGAYKGESYKTDWVMEQPMGMNEVAMTLETVGLIGRVARQTEKMRKAEREGNFGDYKDAKRNLGYSYENLYENMLQIIGTGTHTPTKMFDNAYIKSKARNIIYRSSPLDGLYQ